MAEAFQGGPGAVEDRPRDLQGGEGELAGRGRGPTSSAACGGGIRLGCSATRRSAQEDIQLGVHPWRGEWR